MTFDKSLGDCFITCCDACSQDLVEIKCSLCFGPLDLLVNASVPACINMDIMSEAKPIKSAFTTEWEILPSDS